MKYSDPTFIETIRLIRLIAGAMEQITPDDEIRSEISLQLDRLEYTLSEAGKSENLS